MRKVILISHGKLSEGMAYSAQMVAGEKNNLSYYGLMPGELVEDMMAEIWLCPMCLAGACATVP